MAVICFSRQGYRICIQRLVYFYSEKDLRTNLFPSKIIYINRYGWRFEDQRCSCLTISVIVFQMASHHLLDMENKGYSGAWGSFFDGRKWQFYRIFGRFKLSSSGAPAKGHQAEPDNYRNRITCMHRNRNPYSSFLMVKMASGMDHGRLGPTTTTTMNDVAQHGGHPANTKSCTLGLQRTSLILDIHIMFNWQLSY